MHPFKKMILSKTTEEIILPSYHRFYVKVGRQTCVGGMIGIGTFTYQTIYSSDSTLVDGSLLYSNTELTTLVLFNYCQLTVLGDPFIEIISGVIDAISPIGTPC